MVQRQGSQHPWPNPHENVRDFSLVWTGWTCWAWKLGDRGQEEKLKQPGVFLRWEPNSGPFANTALLMSGYPLLIPLPGRRVCLKLYINFLWRLRNTCAAGSTMTWCFAITSTFLPMCPETGKCNSFADEELVPGGHLALQRWQETKPSLPRLKFAP